MSTVEQLRTEFTRARYRELLRLAGAHYVFSGFADLLGPQPTVWWRHDVDFSVHAAARLAEIERAEGCHATYFLCLRSPFYNLLEPVVIERVRAILALGHEIGLHFDAAFYGLRDESALEAPLAFEQSVIANTFGVPIRSFAFHNPDQFTDAWRAESYAGMINVYSDSFRAIGYVSDSNGYWRYRPLVDVLNDRPHRLQVLTHPAWWQDEMMPPRARVERCVRGRADTTLFDYDRSLERAGRRNVRE